MVSKGNEARDSAANKVKARASKAKDNAPKQLKHLMEINPAPTLNKASVVAPTETNKQTQVNAVRGKVNKAKVSRARASKVKGKVRDKAKVRELNPLKPQAKVAGMDKVDNLAIRMRNRLLDRDAVFPAHRPNRAKAARMVEASMAKLTAEELLGAAAVAAGR